MSSARWQSVSASHAEVDKASEAVFLAPVRSAFGSHDAAPRRDNTAASLNTRAMSSASASAPRDARSLSPATAQQLAQAFPAVHTLVKEQQASMAALQRQVEAKQAELVQCIRTGRELVVHVDALTQRCAALARERDALRQRVAAPPAVHERKGTKAAKDKAVSEATGSAAVAVRDGEADSEAVAAADLLLAAMIVLELGSLLSSHVRKEGGSGGSNNNSSGVTGEAASAVSRPPTLSSVTYCSELPTTQQALQRWLLRALQELKAMCEQQQQGRTVSSSAQRSKAEVSEGNVPHSSATIDVNTAIETSTQEAEWRKACTRAQREADTLRVELDTLHRHVVPELTDEVLELRKQSKLQESELAELRRTAQVLRTQCEGSALRERGALSQLEELRTRCAAAERTSSAVSSQGQRDALVVHNLQHGLQAAEQEIRLRQAQLRQRESELDELRRHRRAAERIVMDALSETQDWQRLVVALREVQSRVAQGLPAELCLTGVDSASAEAAIEQATSQTVNNNNDDNGDDNASLGGALRGFVASVQDLVEDVIERQTRRWQSVRQSVLQVYDAPPRTPSAHTATAQDEEEEEEGSAAHDGPGSAAESQTNDKDESARGHIARLHGAIDTLCVFLRDAATRQAAQSQSAALQQRRAMAAVRAEHEAAMQQLRTTLEQAAQTQQAQLAQQVGELQARGVADQARLQQLLDELERSRAQVSRLERRLHEAEATEESLTRGVSAARTRGEVQCAALQQRLEQLQNNYDALLVRCEAERSAHAQELQVRHDEAHGAAWQAAQAELAAQAQDHTRQLQAVQTALRGAEAEKRAAQETLRGLRAEVAATLARLREEQGAQAAAHAELQRRLQASQEQLELQLARQAAAQEEMQTLRQVNASLEARLQALERDRDPLRRQLHDLLKLHTSERSTTRSLTSPSRS